MAVAWKARRTGMYRHTSKRAGSASVHLRLDREVRALHPEKRREARLRNEQVVNGGPSEPVGIFAGSLPACALR